MQESGRPFIVCAIVVTALAGSIVTAQSARPPSGATTKKFIGTWRLAVFESTAEETRRYRGARPTGLLIYDASGRMSVQIMPDRTRRTFTGPLSTVSGSAAPTPNEAFDAIMGYTAYFGTYTVDERAGTITHHREGNINPGALGAFVRRYIFVSDDRVTLVPVENDSSTLTWERVN